MKKSIFVSAVLCIILAGCATSSQPSAPAPVPQANVEIHVELRAGRALQLGREAQTFNQAISGYRGEEIRPVDVWIVFRNDTLSNDITAGTSVNWITNMPAGLTARVREARKGSNRVILLVEGTSQDILNEAIKFNIPGSVLTRRTQDADFTSTQVKFEITQGSLNLTQSARAAAAAVNFVYVSGTVGAQFNAVDLRVNLTGSALKDAIDREVTVDWVTNCPTGITAVVRPAAAGATTLVLTLRGTPTVPNSDLVQVVIPSIVLGDVENFTVPNESIFWQILGGTVNAVQVSGSVDSAIIARDITVTLLGDVFSSNIAPGTTVTWITNMPSGLTARVKRVRANTNVGVITIAGTPTSESIDNLTLSIPAAVVNSRTNIPIADNPNTRFSISSVSRRISVNEVASGSSNPNWVGTQVGPLNIPVLPAVKDFQGLGLVTVRATAVERLGADNQYHWTGNTVNYGMLVEAAARLNAHAIINIVVDYTDSVEINTVTRELAADHSWSEDELEKISRGILKEERRGGVRFSIETSHVVTRTYIASALAIRYIDGLNFFEAEQARSRAAGETPARR
ncbi:MAG: hypothetical protein FWC01_07600 [Treponema sp.]|nr:hypothetical protein [Treponema sp.]